MFVHDSTCGCCKSCLEFAKLAGAVPPDATKKSHSHRILANFPMQANGAEMPRIACVLMTEAGIRVCAPVHDAVLIEAPLGELGVRVKQAQELMHEASRQVLGGFALTTDADIYR